MERDRAHFLADLPAGKELLAPTTWVIVWDPESVWKLRKKSEVSLFLPVL
jgi:hypothetical protein